MNHKRHKRSKPNCPLDNPNIDIVPENDHLVGICLCQFCECGKHICPKNRHISSQYLSDSFKTSYSRHYQKSNFDIPYKVHPIPYKPNSNKMDFITTNNINYQPCTPILHEKRKASSFSKPKTTLLNTTAYKYYYPNWGQQKVNYEKGWHAPVRSTEIPFRGETSYSREFIQIDAKKVEKYDIKKFSACQTHFSISPRDSFNSSTTYNEKMRDYSTTRLNTHVQIASPKAITTPATSNHYITSTESCYKPSVAAYLDPRKLRIMLLSRGSNN